MLSSTANIVLLHTQCTEGISIAHALFAAISIVAVTATATVAATVTVTATVPSPSPSPTPSPTPARLQPRRLLLLGPGPQHGQHPPRVLLHRRLLSSRGALDLIPVEGGFVPQVCYVLLNVQNDGLSFFNDSD